MSDVARRPLADAVEAHGTVLRAVALRLAGNVADADDLVQDALERALVRAPPISTSEKLRSWLLIVLRNRFIDLCRRRSRRGREGPLDALDELAAPSPDAEDEPPAWADIPLDEVRAAMRQLGDELRMVYELRVVENRSYDEIARTLGIPRATVGTRLFRARRRLRDTLLSAKRGRM